MDRAGRIVGAPANDREALEAGNGAGADDREVLIEFPDPRALDAEPGEHLVVEAPGPRLAQARGRGDGARPPLDAAEAEGEVVGKEEDPPGARRQLGVLEAVGDQLVRRVDRRGLIARHVEEGAVVDEFAKALKGAARAFIPVRARLADALVILIERDEVDAPGVDGDGDGIGEELDGLAQADDRLLQHRVDVPDQGAVLADRLVLEAMDIGDLDPIVDDRACEHASGSGTEVDGECGGHLSSFRIRGDISVEGAALP